MCLKTPDRRSHSSWNAGGGLTLQALLLNPLTRDSNDTHGNEGNSYPGDLDVNPQSPHPPPPPPPLHTIDLLPQHLNLLHITWKRLGYHTLEVKSSDMDGGIGLPCRSGPWKETSPDIQETFVTLKPRPSPSEIEMGQHDGIGPKKTSCAQKAPPPSPTLCGYLQVLWQPQQS